MSVFEGVAASKISAEAQGSDGVVVVYSVNNLYGCRHEKATHVGLAGKMARLKGYTVAAESMLPRQGSGPVYVLPSDTLVGIEAAGALGVHCEDDLFGGVVPQAFVATKAITHPLVEPNANAPAGWSHAFGRRVSDVVLRGFSVFTVQDARHAAARLLGYGAMRVKLVRATAGRGQVVVANAAELEAALDTMDRAELSSHGLVLEENLSDVVTFSVGQVRVADLLVTYYGQQRLTPDNSGGAVYGGSTLVVARGGFDALDGFNPSEKARVAVRQARTYDAAAMECFPGFFASRRNYDVARGRDGVGRWRSGVLEQSWRVGGASGAEIAALEALRAEPTLQAVQASTVELYGESEPPPPHASVYFRGLDEQVGYLTKYATVESYVDPR